MGKRYSKEIRAEVLEKIRNGRKVSEVAREYGINDMTIRTWLQRETEGVTGKEILEMSRLRRENEALYRRIGYVETGRRRVKTFDRIYMRKSLE